MRGPPLTRQREDLDVLAAIPRLHLVRVVESKVDDDEGDHLALRLGDRLERPGGREGLLALLLECAGS